MIFRNNFKLIYLVAINQELNLWRYNESPNPEGFLQMNYCFADQELLKPSPYSIEMFSKILKMQNQTGNVHIYG